MSLGTGVYVLLPRVAREEAGPAVVLSFLVAAVASCLAGELHAEFLPPANGHASSVTICADPETISDLLGSPQLGEGRAKTWDGRAVSGCLVENKIYILRATGLGVARQG